ncbi:exodeoxyribonuclease VII small subunit [Candidatus Fokinia crypta]|uniref:Exodeoxyribonuclease 7 small subunit n=1 Tax=Candidatus Fokinia crypta TaxID=1920990 RepID=A0ABZ0USU5_9RICK|nr:exodeoxyribonuclease VII small subunit [Candidatus Fokinia cryptica]WPX98099.1 Exodeoxyribonuclease 7 small subunit [Candidatus Fokinia cryptica]
MNEKETLLRFERNLQELSNLTKELNEENTPLSSTIELYEKGMKLCKECYADLECIKKIIEVLQDNHQSISITSDTKALSFEKAYKKIEEISQSSTSRLEEAFEKACIVRELKAHCDNLLSSMKVKILETKSNEESNIVKKSDLQDRYSQSYNSDSYDKHLS